MEGNKKTIKNPLKVALLVVLMIVCSFSVFKVIAETDILTITDIKISDKSETSIVNDISFEKLSIISDVSFHKMNDYIVYEITLKNQKEEDYTIESVKSVTDNEYITYSCDNCSGKDLLSGKETKILLTAKYSKQLENLDERTQDLELDLELSLVDREGNVITTNPRTGDSTALYIVSAITSFTAMLIIIFIATEDKRKARITTVLMIALALMVIPAFVSAASNTVNIKLMSKFELYDRVRVITVDENNQETEILVDYNDEISVPNPIEIDGYDFIGWFDEDGNKVSEEIIANKDIKITQKWEIIEYNIDYDLGGGTADNPPKYTIESEDITLPQPTRPGYEFDGWTGSNGDIPQKVVVIPKGSMEDKTFVANWTPIVYTITYTLSDCTLTGTNPTTYTIESDDITLINPTRSGYYFAGWTGSNGTTPQTTVKIPKGSMGNKNYTVNFAQYEPAALRTFNAGDTNVSWTFDTATGVYTITQTAGSSGWGVGVVCDDSVLDINWGQTYMLEYEVYIPDTYEFTTDGNTFFSTTGEGNDIYGTSWLIVDGNRREGTFTDYGAGALPSRTTLSGGTWHTVQMFIMNTNTNQTYGNPEHLPIRSFSGFGLDLTDASSNVTYYIRNLRSLVY